MQSSFVKIGAVSGVLGEEPKPTRVDMRGWTRRAIVNTGQQQQ